MFACYLKFTEDGGARMAYITLQDILDSIDPKEFYGQHIYEGKESGGEFKAKCPLPGHEDDKPSFQFNLKTGKWKCFGCGRSGHYAEFLCEMNHGWLRDDAIQHLREVYGGNNGNGHRPKVKPKEVEPEPPPPPLDYNLVLKYQEDLWKHENLKLLNYLRVDRGFTDETIAKWMIGVDKSCKRFTLPIFDADGNLVNIRKYKPGAKEPEQKWLNTKGYGSPARLFPAVPEGKRVIICEGEFDTIIATQNQCHAITGTGGCGVWLDEWSPLFAGKIVVICYDNDKAGREASIRVAESLAPYAASVRILNWPEIMPDKGDITDFFVKLKLGYDSFRYYLDQAREYVSVTSLNIPKDFKGIVPDRGFLRSYISFMTSLTDACPEYHLATGLSIISAAVGNRVKFYGHAGRLYKLNLWTVLLGPSGDRKSTAINKGLDLLNIAVPDSKLPNQYSQESLLKAMQGKERTLLFHDEFYKLLKESKRDHMVGIIPTLTELYEQTGEYEYNTIKGGKVVISDPALSIIAASTLDWMQEMVDDSIIKGGFLPRFLFWPGGRRAERKGLVGRPDPVIEASLIDALQTMSKLEGIAEFPDDVSKRYDEWDQMHEAQITESKCSPQLRAFFKRMPTYLLKFAVLYQISNDMRDLTVTLEAMEQAIRTIEYVKRNLTTLVDQEFSGDREYKQINKVFHLIKDSGTVDYSTLLRMSHMSSYSLERILKTLVDMERIEVQTVKSGRKPKRVYQAL